MERKWLVWKEISKKKLVKQKLDRIVEIATWSHVSYLQISRFWHFDRSIFLRFESTTSKDWHCWMNHLRGLGVLLFVLSLCILGELPSEKASDSETGSDSRRLMRQHRGRIDRMVPGSSKAVWLQNSLWWGQRDMGSGFTSKEFLTALPGRKVLKLLINSKLLVLVSNCHLKILMFILWIGKGLFSGYFPIDFLEVNTESDSCRCQHLVPRWNLSHQTGTERGQSDFAWPSFVSPINQRPISQQSSLDRMEHQVWTPFGKYQENTRVRRKYAGGYLVVFFSFMHCCLWEN